MDGEDRALGDVSDDKLIHYLKEECFAVRFVFICSFVRIIKE